LFDVWVRDHKLPSPRKIGGVVLWDRFSLDVAIEALFYPDDDLAAWDDVRT
jgi:hypothetical protein